MKKIRRIMAVVLSVIMLMALVACNATQEEFLVAADRAQAWVQEQMKNNTLFSFDYDGKAFQDVVGGFEKTVEQTDTGWTLTYRTPEGVTAWAEVEYLEERAVLNWCCYFKNEGASDSPVISNIRAMNAKIKMNAPVLTTAHGSDTDAEEFQPITYDLTQTTQTSFGSAGGRSSQGGFPYFDICDNGTGILGAIGWTGQWTANFTFEDGVIAMDTGMVETAISLHADEDMRTPSTVLLFFDGDQDNGHNQFRQLILQEISPKDEQGNAVTQLPEFFNLWGGNGEVSHLNAMDLRDRLGVAYDGLWIDAGWSGEKGGSTSGDGLWFQDNGNLYVNTKLYPDGFTNLAQKLHEEDRELLVWFEPERAFPGTQMVTDHPEYYLPKPDTANFYLFDFGNDDACDFLIDMIDGIIKDNGIDWYRQDFNVEPYYTWVAADREQGENRVGMTEIQYITNLYRYVDTLLERNPGLAMDNCASGGKRLDIEMMSRSFPLWRTDYSLAGGCYGDDVRSINYNLTYWLPLHAGGAGAADGRTTDYTWRCAMAAGMTNGTLVPDDMAWYLRMKEQYDRCHALMAGDYYILSQGIGDRLTATTAVYEFYVPENGEGYLLVFRPGACPDTEGVYKLKGLDPAAQYTLECVDTDQTIEATGAELMENGLTLTIEDSGTSLLIFITKK